MNSEQFEQFMKSQRELYRLNLKILSTQELILKVLEIMVTNQQIKDPDYQHSLEEYQNFDWSNIGAKILDRDSDGVSAVSWHGKIYKRRSPENKFAPAIWFSRKQGNDYYKLITFKTIEAAEPLSRKVLAKIYSS